MLRKCFLVPMVGVVALLALTVDVQAQTLRERRLARRGIVYTPLNVAPMTPGVPLGMTPTVQTTAVARISYYPTPVNENLGDCAQIKVILPNAQCKVFFDGKATTSMGTERMFLTPALAAGTANSSYLVRCTWMQNGQEMVREQMLQCAPNTTYVLDFTAASR